MKTLTDQIRDAIKNSGVSRYSLAKDTGISESVLSRFLNGSAGFTLKNLDKLADILGLRVVSTVQRTSRPRYRGIGKKVTEMLIQSETQEMWEDTAKMMAQQSHENLFQHRRGVWHLAEVDRLCIYNNNPYTHDKTLRDRQTAEFRTWLKKNKIKELAYGTFSGDEDNPDYTYAMIIDAGIDLMDEVVDVLREIACREDDSARYHGVQVMYK